MRRKKLNVPVNSNRLADEPRLEKLKHWLAGFADAELSSLQPASNDASFRRYFRLNFAGTTAIVMDAPPDKEDCESFVAIAGYLAEMGLNAPEVLASNLEDGFLLLSDLGSDLFLPALDGDSANALYRDAIDALLTMRARGDGRRGSLPPYNGEYLKTEMALFHDWLCQEYLGLVFDAEAEAAWNSVNELLIAGALQQPRVFVHRDYHSRNLMLNSHNPGIIDFQDAMNGPLTYDLVSLLKDCYINWPRQRVLDWTRYYYDHAHLDVAWPVFLRWFDFMGVQRHLKASGIFARLYLRDGKPGYLKDIPRTLDHIVALQDDYPELDWLCRWITLRVIPRLESRA